MGDFNLTRRGAMTGTHRSGGRRKRRSGQGVNVAL